VSAADNITVTVGWIARHTPKGAGAGGREAAILDIAQDLLLRELHEVGSREFDLDDIGALAVPVPTEAELAKTVSTRYAFLADLDTEERQLAGAREQDRDLALRLLAKLPGARLAQVGLY